MAWENANASVQFLVYFCTRRNSGKMACAPLFSFFAVLFARFDSTCGIQHWHFRDSIFLSCKSPVQFPNLFCDSIICKRRPASSIFMWLCLHTFRSINRRLCTAPLQSEPCKCVFWFRFCIVTVHYYLSITITKHFFSGVRIEQFPKQRTEMGSASKWSTKKKSPQTAPKSNFRIRTSHRLTMPMSDVFGNLQL